MEKKRNRRLSPRGYSLAKSPRLHIGRKFRHGSSKAEIGETSRNAGRWGAKKPKQVVKPSPASMEIDENQTRRRRLVLEEESDDGISLSEIPRQVVPASRGGNPPPVGDGASRINKGKGLLRVYEPKQDKQ
ncbi:unnamed protein product [Linum trigynum]